jgi:hypothetical protein
VALIRIFQSLEKETMSTKYVYATAACGTDDDAGMPVNLRAGEVWDALDPFPQSHPGLFSTTPPPPFPLRSVPVVEQPDAEPSSRRRFR